MIKITDNDIELTRGDTETLEITVLDAEGNPYTLQSGEYIELVVKQSPESSDVLIRKTTTDGTITFSRSDTWELQKGKYAYNIRLEDGISSYHTIIEGKLIITSVVDDA